MSSRARLAATIYVVLGLVLAAIGFLLAVGANLGVVADSVTLRVVALVTGFALVFIGVHISIAGLSSLRASTS